MSTAPLYFTGVSSYSNDFQSIISRQVQIARIPITQLQNRQSDNTQKIQLLEGLESAASALGKSIASLGSIGSSKGLVAGSSDPAITATNTGATQATSYRISNIQSLAAPASETSLTGYADSNSTRVSSNGSLQLILGSQTYAITLNSAQNNLVGLRDAINASGAAVTASILTSGTGSDPNYLVVSANNNGATTLQLNDVPTGASNPVALLTNAEPIAENGTGSFADTATTPFSATGSLQLVLGVNTYDITLGAGQNNLDGLVDAINHSGADVIASIADAGSGSDPYSLVVTANHIGPTTLQLNDAQADGSEVNLLSGVNNNATQGSDAVFDLNGIHIEKSSNTINDVIPGLVFTLNSKATHDVTLSLNSDTSTLSSALGDLTAKYNALVDLVDRQTGSTAGLLQGDISIHAVLDDMRQLTTYQSGGSKEMSLAALGITFDTAGKMSFDPGAVSGFSDSQLANAFSFLGSSTTGFGAIASQFTQLADPVRGMFQLEQNGLTTANANLTDQVGALNDRLSRMQMALTAQIQQADAAVAALQSQQQVLFASVQAVNLALYGRNYGSALS